jgi:hypothetical protein
MPSRQVSGSRRYQKHQENKIDKQDEQIEQAKLIGYRQNNIRRQDNNGQVKEALFLFGKAPPDQKHGTGIASHKASQHPGHNPLALHPHQGRNAKGDPDRGIDHKQDHSQRIK